MQVGHTTSLLHMHFYMQLSSNCQSKSSAWLDYSVTGYRTQHVWTFSKWRNFFYINPNVNNEYLGYMALSKVLRFRHRSRPVCRSVLQNSNLNTVLFASFLGFFGVKKKNRSTVGLDLPLRCTYCHCLVRFAVIHITQINCIYKCIFKTSAWKDFHNYDYTQYQILLLRLQNTNIYQKLRLKMTQLS